MLSVRGCVLRCAHRTCSSHSTLQQVSATVLVASHLILYTTAHTWFSSLRHICNCRFCSRPNARGQRQRLPWRGRHGVAAASPSVPATERVTSRRTRDHGQLLHTTLLLLVSEATLEAAAGWGAFFFFFFVARSGENLFSPLCSSPQAYGGRQ